MKKTGLNGDVYDFSVDYDAVAVDDILNIHKYLMEKMTQYKVFVVVMTFFSYHVLNVYSLECVSMNNQECKTRTKIINISNNEPVFVLLVLK